MTTNGYCLEKNAHHWFEAGLDAINVWVDGVGVNTFNLITGKNIFNKVIDGVNASIRAGYLQIKINSVLMKGINEGDLVQFSAWIKKIPIQLRFIKNNKYHVMLATWANIKCRYFYTFFS